MGRGPEAAALRPEDALPEMVNSLPEWAAAGRAGWRFTGKERPAIAHTPGKGQRSVWDFPRPPAIEAVDCEVRVRLADVGIARTRRCLRVLETGGPPTYYLPGSDVERRLLRATAQGSRCEWKGEARYWELDLPGAPPQTIAWSYPDPFPEFERLRDHFSFYPGRVECFLGPTRAQPQPGGFYGGWVTPELVGPFKGEPGTESL